MTGKSEPPSIDKVAFSCPHCGAYTSHTWLNVQARTRSSSDGAPGVWTADLVESVRRDTNMPAEARASFVSWAERAATGEILLAEKAESAYTVAVTNIALSRCFACKDFAIWKYNRLVYPSATSGPEPNPDLSADVLRDYKEALSIVALSPRGAAALLRLAIQKLCKELGESGKNIDRDIASLVTKGLNPMIQKALDIVRVIGNEAVHPGVIDLRDDTTTALKLFGLVNLIAEQMISAPKHVGTLFDSLPEEKRKAIEDRDNHKGVAKK